MRPAPTQTGGIQASNTQVVAGMPAGVIVSPDRSSHNVIDNAISMSRAAHEAGVQHVWLPQNFDYDALALAALVGSAVPGLGVGTSVVPVNPRHPLIIASGAQTAQAASHGNFSLGLGLGAPSLEQKTFGISPVNTVQRLREHLLVLRSIQESGTVNFHGEELTAVDPRIMPVALIGSKPFPIYIAAMGPRALQLAGELADGTLLNLAGPRTIERFIVPTIGQAAADADRPGPKVIAMVLVAITDDADKVRAETAARVAVYETVPSYRKVLDREGVAHAAELAVIGDARAVTGKLRTYLDAGATDVVLVPLQTELDDLREVWDLAATF
jgi:F420-dependent oxidoreductase-like protein